MNWMAAVPVALVTVAWLLVPGLLISYLLGLRGVAAWGLAPVTGIALIASTAVLGGFIGIGWSVGFVLVVTAVVVAVVGLGAWSLRRTGVLASDPDPRRVTLVAGLGLLPAVVLGVTTLVQAMGAPDTLSQTYDAVYHYNTLAYIEESHRASSLQISGFGNPQLTNFFYPAAWHDLASLVMLSTGAGIPLAANAVTVVTTVLIWPLSCLLLARQLFGPHPAALAITATLSIGFTAFPWDLLGFGVLWPNLLGLAIAPALLAVVLTLTRWAQHDTIGTTRAWLALTTGLLAAGFAHPNVLFSLAVLAIIPIAARVATRAWRLHTHHHTTRGITETTAFLTVFSLAWWWAATTPTFASTRDQYWPPFETPANAVGEVLLNATHRHDALWLLSITVILGIIAARHTPLLWLLVTAHLTTTVLYVLTAAINRTDTEKFTGYWYNDSHRLAAMLPITAVPLATAGILYLTHKITTTTTATAQHENQNQRENQGKSQSQSQSEGQGTRRLAAIPGIRSANTVAVGLTLALVLATGGLYPTDRYNRVASTYHPKNPETELVTQEMRDFYHRIASKIPDNAVVAGNPFQGSALLWALEDRNVLFPHFRTTTTDQQDLIAQHLNDLMNNPNVCDAVNNLNVKYLLIGGAQFRTRDNRWNYYTGLTDPHSTHGFELIDSSGPSKLYKITGCDRTVTRPAE